MERLASGSLVLLLIQAVTCIDKLALATNVAMQLTTNSTSGAPGYVFQASPVFTIIGNNPTAAPGTTVQMIVDLASDTVQVPGVTGGNQPAFGIMCTQSTQCFVSQGTVPCGYGAPATATASLTCKPATTLMRFAQGVSVPSSFAVQGLKIGILDLTDAPTSQAWTVAYGQSGVLGLSAKSDFWQFLPSAYDFSSNTVQVSVNYKISDPANQYKPTAVQAKNAQVTINGRSTDGKVTLKPYNATNYGGSAWVIENARLTLHSDFDMTNVPICVDTSVNAYFLLDDASYLNVTGSVNKQLCAVNATDACPSKNSSFTNVDNMKVTFNTTKGDKTTVSIILGAADFISDDATGTLSLNGLSPLNSSKVCNGIPGIQYGLGRLFFTRAEITIQSSDQGFSVGISEIPREKSIIFPILLISLAVVIVTVIGLIAYFNFPKKEPKPEGDSYKAAS